MRRFLIFFIVPTLQRWITSAVAGLQQLSKKLDALAFSAAHGLKGIEKRAEMQNRLEKRQGISKP